MIAEGAPRIGVLGGTFDPPHLAHLVLAAAARRQLGLARVLFVVAGEPWRKADREVSPPEARVRMVEAAVADLLPWAEVSRVEVDREGPSYSAETMELLAAEGPPGAAWWFLCGRDALADLPHWHEPQRLVAAARFAVAHRGDEEEAPIPPETESALPGIASRVDRVAMPALDVSATELRRRVAEGVPTAPLLPGAVRAVIEELGLYRSG